MPALPPGFEIEQPTERPAPRPPPTLPPGFEIEPATLVQRERLNAQMQHPAAAPVPEEGLVRTGARGLVQGGTLGAGDEATGLGVAAARRPVEAATGLARLVGSLEPTFGSMTPQQAPNVEAPDPLTGETRRFGEIASEVGQAEREGFSRGIAESPGQAAAGIGGALVGGLAASPGIIAGARALGLPVEGGRGALATGTATGAVAGAAGAQPGERIEGAATGAGLGLTVGAFTGGIGAAMRAVRPGHETLLRDIGRQSGLSPTQIESRLLLMGDDATGQGATLADVSRNFGLAGDVAAARLGPNAEAVQALIRRDEKAFGRLVQPLMRAVQSGAGRLRDAAVRTISELKQVRQIHATPLYERAYSQPWANNDRLRDLLSRPSAAKAWARTKKRVGLDDPDIDPAILGEGAEPSLRGWTHIVGQLHRKYFQHTRGEKPDLAAARNVAGLRRAIQVELDKTSSPTGRIADSPYHQARRIWADTKQADDALEEGSKFMARSPSEVDEIWKGMDDVERQFYKLGTARAMEQKLAAVRDTSDATLMLRNQAFRDKVKTVFEPDEAVDFLNTVRAEAIKKNTTNTVGRGSQTEIRRQVSRQLGGEEIGEAPATIIAAGRKVLRGLGLRSGPSESEVQTLGSLLLSQKPADHRRALDIMRRSFDTPLGELAAQSRVGAIGAGTPFAGEALRSE